MVLRPTTGIRRRLHIVFSGVMRLVLLAPYAKSDSIMSSSTRNGRVVCIVEAHTEAGARNHNRNSAAAAWRVEIDQLVREPLKRTPLKRCLSVRSCAGVLACMTDGLWRGCADNVVRTACNGSEQRLLDRARTCYHTINTCCTAH